MAEYIERGAAYREICADETMSGYEKAYCCEIIKAIPAANVAPARHCLCGVCSGKQIITQDCDNGYSLEIEPEQSELAVGFGDQCMAVFSIDYCPICGAKMECGNDG